MVPLISKVLTVLTFRMSPTVYSGFGLACTKVKEKFKKFHYHFSKNLRSPKFKRNSCLHRRLRDFLRSSSLSSESLRVPRGTLRPRPCFVQWVPSFAQCIEKLPTPDSLARYLGDGTRCKLKSSLSITQWSNPLRLPDLFVQSQTGHPTAANEQELRQSVDLNKVRAVFNILSCLITGIACSPERDENANYNPCMTEMHLAPSLALDWLAAVPPTWSFHNPICVRLDGLFTVEQATRLENTVRDLVEHSQMERCFAFWVKRPLLLDSATGTSCPESSSNVRLFLTNRQTAHPFTVLNLSVD
ncbi:uncharacterized protein DEA37_0001630 [Paragonimus westermani]|uniref:Uncharacterized protein n=1 Tax=Paragonimus westermani TaxID=34504 RepID=A0A5J4P3A8_9TREM|nr:uncharacterized protein DEA37_0001630 [Paragonimus westermani]